MSLTIVPSVDLREGKVVRLKQGDYARQVTYPADPIATARSFAEAGAEWMHIVDLDGAKAGKPVQTKLIKEMIKESGLKVQAGGGIRDRGGIEDLLYAGAQRAVVGTKAMEDWPWFKRLMDSPQMHGRVVLALDAKEGVVATRGWTESTGRLATDVAALVSDWPLGAILYTDVAKDGMMTGPNVEHTKRLAEAGKVPVIASGGVGNVEHIRQLVGVGVWGVIVGRSLYEGTVELKEALAVARGTGA